MEPLLALRVVIAPAAHIVKRSQYGNTLPPERSFRPSYLAGPSLIERRSIAAGYAPPAAMACCAGAFSADGRRSSAKKRNAKQYDRHRHQLLLEHI